MAGPVWIPLQAPTSPRIYDLTFETMACPGMVMGPVYYSTIATLDLHDFPTEESTYENIEMDDHVYLFGCPLLTLKL
jgi:hypothetical protein